MTALFAVLIGLLPTSLDGDGTWSDFGLYSREFDEFAPRFWMYVFIAAAGLMIVLSLTRFRFRGHKKYFRRTLAVLMAFCIVTGICYVAIGRSYGDDPETYIIPKEIEAEEWMLPDDHFYRVDTVDALDNIAMYWDMSCINCFHSIVPASIMEFYESIGITRDVPRALIPAGMCSAPSPRRSLCLWTTTRRTTIYTKSDISTSASRTASASGKTQTTSQWDFHTTVI